MSAPEDRNNVEQREIEALEQREANAMLGADTSTLQTLWADDMVVNSTANLIAGKKSCSRWSRTDNSSCAFTNAVRSASQCSAISSLAPAMRFLS